MSEPVIVLDKLSKRFGDVQAVRDVSLTIVAGTIFGFLGANGAGKTTTIRMLCGLTHPTGGRATISGHDVWQERQLVRAKFGYVAQRFSLYPDLTVEENFRFFGGACRVPVTQLEERIGNLLGLTDLEEKRDTPAGSLSGGMRQLLALGCALVHDPPLLFLDEPTSDLDPLIASGIDALILQLNRSLGVTVVVVSHDLTTLFTICDRIAVLVDKKITIGTLDNLMRSNQPWIHEFLHGPRAEGAKRSAMTARKQSHGNG